MRAASPQSLGSQSSLLLKRILLTSGEGTSWELRPWIIDTRVGRELQIQEAGHHPPNIGFTGHDE